MVAEDGLESAATTPMTALDGSRSTGPTTIPQTRVETGDDEPVPIPAELSSQSGPSAPRRFDSLVEREERIGFRDRLLRALLIGLGGWCAFLIVDLTGIYLLHDTSAWALAARGWGALGLGSVLLIERRRDTPSWAELRFVEVAMFVCGMMCMALLAACHDDGITSYHVPGSVLVVLSYGVMLGSPWRHALLPVTAMTLAFPAALFGFGPLVTDTIATQVRSPEAVARFLMLYSVVIGGAALTLIGGQLFWGLRQQVAESRSIGRYKLLRRIAQGGMGEVWAAYHAGLKRDVAVKLIRARKGRDELQIERFEREVRATAELTHPNTVRVFDYGVTADGIWYYAMELLEGDDLEKIVRRQGRFGPRRALRSITQAAQALEEAHLRGIVHRDIKPANLLLTGAETSSEYVKLIDFGIARTGDEEGGLTHTGMVVGTPGYMAPEVIAGEPASPRADVYALGAVLYYMLVGSSPFEGETPRSVALSQLSATIEPPSGRQSIPVPEPLEQILMRCLAKDPEDRYPDAGALARALLDCKID